MRHAFLTTRGCRCTVAGLAAAAVAVIALAAAPAALANLDPASAVTQEQTQLPDLSTDTISPSGSDGGADTGDVQSLADEDAMLIEGSAGLVTSDSFFDGLGDATGSGDGGAGSGSTRAATRRWSATGRPSSTSSTRSP